MDIQTFQFQFTQTIVDFFPRLVGAFVVLVLGWHLVPVISQAFTKAMERARLDKTLRPFLASLVSAILRVLLVFSTASMVGIETASFIAVMGAASLAIGLALKDSMSHFAGGSLLLFLKPYRIGQYVEVNNFKGEVVEVQIFHTILRTSDGKTVYIPNGKVVNSEITNYSRYGKRMVKLEIGIAYDTKIEKAKKIAIEIAKADERVLSDKEPIVGVENLGESSIDIFVRVWCTSKDYLALKRELLEKIKVAFDKEKIEIPFPQQEVHMYQHKV